MLKNCLSMHIGAMRRRATIFLSATIYNRTISSLSKLKQQEKKSVVIKITD